MQIVDPTPFFSGVYATRHKPSGSMYVGCTRDLRMRWEQHRWLLRHQKHDQPRLQEVWTRDGVSEFELVLLEWVRNPDAADSEGFASSWAWRRNLLAAERRWQIKLISDGVPLLNKTAPRSGTIQVVDETTEALAVESDDSDASVSA